MGQVVVLEDVMALIKQLPAGDKERLIAWIAPEIDREPPVNRPMPRKSLRGLWRGLDITEEDIAEARREMWGSFPREDV
jgi:hypothetical protein